VKAPPNQSYPMAAHTFLSLPPCNLAPVGKMKGRSCAPNRCAPPPYPAPPMKSLLLIPLLLLPAACGKKDNPKPAEETQTESTVETPRKSGPIAGQYAVQCGCEIDSIGSCGNYVHVDGHPFEILGDLGLGEMEWCSTEGGAQADVKGVLKDDKFYGESLTVKP